MLEIARRRHYREAAETVIRGMMEQLEAMTAGEWEFSLLLPILGGVFSDLATERPGAQVIGSHFLCRLFLSLYTDTMYRRDAGSRTLQRRARRISS